MKALIPVLCLMLAAAPLALAQDKPHTKVEKSQTQRMRFCTANANQAELKDEARKKYLAECMSGKAETKAAAPAQKKPAPMLGQKAPPPEKKAAVPEKKPVLTAAQAAEQRRWSECTANANQGELKDEARKKFMDECMKRGAPRKK